MTINFTCLNSGNYRGRGSEYVNILSDMVRRNMPPDVPWKFFCLTDDPIGLNEEVQVIPLPLNLKGWWGKLYLFKQSVLPDSRIIYFDLDTVIVGSLKEIIRYEGDFAILRDYYRPDGYGSGVMMWNKPQPHIWENWIKEGRPETPDGDQGWIEKQVKADLLQDLFPEKFPSYKVHCNPYPPKNSAVVSFHGHPKPDNCQSPWVDMIWKIGGGMTPELVREINTAQDVLIENVKSSSERDIPWVDLKQSHDGVAVIVGGGPSLSETIGEIKKLALDGASIIALNGAAKYLLSEGIPVTHQVMLDARKETAEFVSPADHYFIGSTCHPSVFDKIDGQITLFHPYLHDIEEIIPDSEKPLHFIGGGSTVGLIALSLLYTQGYRNIHLFGYDSSYKDKKHHAYSQDINNGENCVDVVCEGRSFKCAAWMVTQAQEFQETSVQLAELGCEIHVHGNGLLPHMAWAMARK